MLLTNAYQLPYLDPNGYDMVAASDLEVLARRVDAIVSGFDARTAGLLARPTLIKEASANGIAQPVDAAGKPGDCDADYDVTRFDNSGGGLTVQYGNYFSVDPAKLNPNCYVLMHFTGNAYVTGGYTATAWYRAMLTVFDSSRGVGYEKVADYYQSTYGTAAGEENFNTMALIRLRPSQIVSAHLVHTNAASSVYIASGSTSVGMTYLMEAN